MSLSTFFASPCRSHAAPSAVLYLVKVCAAVCILTIFSALPSPAQYPGYGPYAPQHQWVVTYESQGTATYGFLGPFGVQPRNPTAWPADSNGYNSNSTGSGDVNRATSGSVIATLIWYPATGKDITTDPPDKTVYIQETATAQDSPGSWYGNGTRPEGAGSVDNGFGDPVIKVGSGLRCRGAHLIQRDGSSRKIVLEAVSLSAATPTTSFPDGNPDWHGSGSASVSLEVATDNRAVAISASVDEDFYKGTYYKGVPNDTDPGNSFNADGDLVYQRKQHIRKPDGSMDGDIGIAYGEQHLDNRGNTEIVTSSLQNVTYTAHIAGNWATWMSQYLWNSSLKNYSTSGSLYHLNGIGLPTEADIPVLPNTYVGANVDGDHKDIIIPNEAAAMGTNDHIFFRFTNGDNRSTGYPTGNDGDGATATANYNMKIHQPVEILKSNKPDEPHFRTGTPNPRPNSDDIQINPIQPYYAVYGGGIPCTWNDPSPVFTTASGVTSELGDVSFARYPWISAVAGILNIAIDKLGPKPDNGTGDFSDTVWKNSPAENFPSDYPKDSNTLKARYHMIPILSIEYKRQFFLKDDYSDSGFVSEELGHTEKFVGISQWLGEFYIYSRP